MVAGFGPSDTQPWEHIATLELDEFIRRKFYVPDPGKTTYRTYYLLLR